MRQLAKQSKKIAVGLLLSSALVGCSNVQTTVKKSDTTLFKVGDTTVTKGQAYEEVKISSGSDYTVDEIKEKIENAEITSGKKIDAYIEELYQKYVEAYDNEESFISQLSNYGYDGVDEFKKNQLKPQAKEELLEQKYLKLNKKKYFKEYKPSVVRVLAVKNKKKATEALEKLNSGTSWDDIYVEYTTDGSSYSNEDTILTTSSSGFSEKNIKEVYETKELGIIQKEYKTTVTGDKTQYIVQVVSTDRMSDAYFGDITTEITNNDTDFSTKMWTHYMKKHKVEIYDQDIFDYLRENNPEYLYQYPELKENKDSSSES